MKVLTIVLILVLFSIPLTPISKANFVEQPTTEYIHDNQYSVHLPIIITDEADFSLLGFPGTGTSSDPYVIEGFNISRAGSCISIAQTSVFFVIRDCYLNGMGYGTCVSLEDVEHGQIENCIIDGGTYGIFLSRCEGTRIENNIVFGANEQGIQAQLGGFINIVENNIFANERGIYVNGADNSSILNNRVYSNTRLGIEIAQHTEFNEIYQNSIGWNVGYLSFIEEINAEDNGENNTWYENRWSDYLPPDLYFIPGDANAIDSRPSRLSDSIEPVISAPVIEPVVQGNETAILKWTIVEEFPFSYELYQNGERVDHGYLTKNSVTRALGSLPIGEYNFTIWVSDGFGNVETLQQIVKIIPASDTSSILLAGIGISVILVVVVIWEKILRPRRSS